MCTGEAGHCFVGEIENAKLLSPALLRQCVGEINIRCQSSIEAELYSKLFLLASYGRTQLQKIGLKYFHYVCLSGYLEHCPAVCDVVVCCVIISFIQREGYKLTLNLCVCLLL